MCAAYALSGATTARAQGASIRLVPPAITQGQPFVVEVEIDAPPSVLKRVEIAVHGEVGDWVTSDAVQVRPGRWTARFPWPSEWKATTVGVELRVRGVSPRGGTVVTLGVPVPVPVPVRTPREAEQRRALRAEAASGEDLALLEGLVGTDARLGSAGRIRIVLGGTGYVTRRTALFGLVSVGPTFSLPAELSESGPIVLGLEAGARWFTRPPPAVVWAPFLETSAVVDLRLPGVDVGGGVRAGVSWGWSRFAALDVSVGGALLAERVDTDPQLAVHGGLRVLLRLRAAR